MKMSSFYFHEYFDYQVFRAIIHMYLCTVKQKGSEDYGKIANGRLS